MKTAFLLLLLALAPTLCAQLACRPYAVEITVTTQASPAQITLTWTADANATSHAIYRRAQGASSWGASVATVSGATLTWTDSTVVVGTAYEYAVIKSAGSYSGSGFATAGIEVAAIEDRGRLILIVDNTHTTALAGELTRLQRDLEGDGWTVLRHDVAPGDTVVSVRNTILADYNASPATTRAVFLFGHVPVPYSGNFNPDAHPDHQGAWPADVFYGELNGSWTDTSINTATNPTPPSRTQNQNVPGDGKYDQSTIPGTVELQVGRVDFANMPAFAVSEQELLRAYLNKHHDFRHKVWSPQMRAVVDDNFGVLGGVETFAAGGWRGFAPMFGPANVNAGDFITDTTAGSYMWAYGCGGGSYTSAGGIGNTSSFAASSIQVAFTSLFGSYFGDWDSTNNFLRAPLAGGKGLTCCWSGRPDWYWHGMALGETIGDTFLYTVNRPSLANPPYSNKQVHIALMGDPTLRMHVIAPATGLTAAQNGTGVDLAWTASTDTVLGYHVYRNAGSGWTRLTTSPVNTGAYTDAAPPLGGVEYMVRAVRLEQGSGSYYNLSQGQFANLTVATGLPVINTHPANRTAPVGATATFSVAATGPGTLTYQWQRDTIDITGATSDSYTTPALVAGDDGAQFRCVVTNAGGSTTSNAATLTIGTAGPPGGGGGGGGGGGCAAAGGAALPLALLLAPVFVGWRRRKPCRRRA